MSDLAIAASGLQMAYGDKVVLEGIDLEVPAGTVFSLLGPNGAGKTTTVNVLTTLTKADNGTHLPGRADDGANQPFVQRMRGHRIGQLHDHARAVAETYFCFEPILHRRQAEPLEPSHRRVERFTVAQPDVLHGRTAPQAHGFAQQPDSPGIPHLASLSDEALEPRGIHSIGVHRQPVAACLPLDQPFRQRLAQPGNLTLQGVRRVGRRVLTPDPIDERRLRDYAICFEREGG